jgi:ATP-dependent Lon protease
MVFTRSQKRKFDENDSIHDNYQLDNDYSSIKFYKKKKKQNKDNQNEDCKNEYYFDVNSESKSFIKDENISQLTDENTSQNTCESASDETFDDSRSDDVDYYLKNIIKNVIRGDVKKVYKNTYNDIVFKDEYDKYLYNLSNIYSGNFFQTVSKDEQKQKLEENFSVENIKQLNDELEQIKTKYNQDIPSVIDILKMDVNIEQKQKLLEKMYQFSNSEILTSDYCNSLKVLNDNIKQSRDIELIRLEKEILDKSNDLKYTDNYKEKILKSDMSFDNKVIAYKRLQVMESFESNDTAEYSKYKNWIDILLSVPFNKTTGTEISSDIQESTHIIKSMRATLDKRLSFLEKAKDQVINITTQIIRNPNFAINAIGLYGPKGVGKTNLVKSISEALGRPYRSISLGGESESSLLSGHGFTYVGSCPGRIIEILRETKCMNPIILFDELDKVSETHQGKEIIGSLIHLTDSSSNNKYNYDKYFAGVEFDLSKVLFIFTYNDASKIDPILADRLLKIRIDNYSLNEKMEITNKHLISCILNQYCFTKDDIVFEDDAIKYIVETSQSEQGMRDIKRKFEIIISRVNTLLLTDPENNIVKLKYKELYNYYKQQISPVKILKQHVDTLLTDSVCLDSTSDQVPFGMYI